MLQLYGFLTNDAYNIATCIIHACATGEVQCNNDVARYLGDRVVT